MKKTKKKKNNYFIYVLRTLVILAVIAFAILMGSTQLSTKTFYIESPDYKDSVKWGIIFDNENPYQFESDPIAVIVPKDVITLKELSKFYEGLSTVKDPSTVIVMNSNLDGISKYNIQTCENCVYRTIKGNLNVNEFLAAKMIEENAAHFNDKLFLEDDIISMQTPFIKKYFPEANIVPVLINSATPKEELNAFSDFLTKYLTNESLIIVTSNFSEKIPREAAEFHNHSSFATIANFDYENIYDLDIDSPAALYSAINFAEQKDFKDVRRIAYINSDQLLKERNEETSEYQFIGFLEGEADKIKGASIFSTGNIFENSDLNFMKEWLYDPDFDENDDRSAKKYLKNLKGIEDRFLTGIDYYVFDLEADQCRREVQNGFKVSFCKFIENEENISDFNEMIQNENEASDILYLLFEFRGDQELSADRKYLIRDFVKKGVDVFVGRGILTVVPFEIYRDSLIFYSLGNFIPGDKLITELNDTSEGMIVGLYIDKNYYYIYTFPIEIINGYPKLKPLIERPGELINFTKDLKLKRSDEIDPQKGFVKISRN